jgi:hypothetical protein
MIDFLRNLVFKDFWLKLFSLALAILVWKFVNEAVKKQVPPARAPESMIQPLQRQTFLRLPVVVMSSASDVRSFRVDTSEVAVTVQGDPALVEKLLAKEIHPIVDLTGIESARDLRKRIDVVTPSGISYVRVDPPEVEIIFPTRQP